MRIRLEAALERLIEIQEATEALIAVLDDRDGDTDLEDGGDDEPSLASLTSNATISGQFGWSLGGTDDREDEHDGSEPSLGWPDYNTVWDYPLAREDGEFGRVTRWGVLYGTQLFTDYGLDDREDEHDGREPSLCGLTVGSGDDHDRELDLSDYEAVNAKLEGGAGA